MYRCRPAALALLAALVACTSPDATGTSSVGEPVTVSPSAGATALTGVPPDFPIMPGSVAVEPLPQEAGLLGCWKSPADGSQVYAFFVEALPASGFRIDELLPGGSVAVIRFKTAGGGGLDLQLTLAGDATRIDLRQPDDQMR
jgi:hypothetical protein